MFRQKRPGLNNALLVTTWLLLTVIVVSLGMLISGSLAAGSGSRPLSAGEVTQALADSTERARQNLAPGTTPDAPKQEPAPASPAPAPAPTLLRSTGGTVVAACSDRRATIVSATAAQGYTVDDKKEKAPASVSFESEATKIRFELSCSGSTPTGTETSTTKPAGHESKSSD